MNQQLSLSPESYWVIFFKFLVLTVMGNWKGGVRDGHGGDCHLYRLTLITVFTVTLVCLKQTFVSSLPRLTLTSLRLVFNSISPEGEFTIYQDFFSKITC